MTAGMVPQQEDVIQKRAESEVAHLLHRAKALCSILISKVDGTSLSEPTKANLESVCMLAWQIEENLEEALRWNEGLRKVWTPPPETTARP